MDDRGGNNKQQITSTSRQLTLPTSRPPALQRQASINPVTPSLIDTSVNNISSGYSSDVTISHTASDAHLVVIDATTATTNSSNTTASSSQPALEEEEVNTNLFQVMYDYQANHDDELTLFRGNTIKLISKQTGDEGWWNGFNLSEGKKGIFPSNYVEPILLNYKRELPPQIPYENLEFKECIGSGGFGKVFKGFWTKESGQIEMVAIKKARIEGDKENLINSVKESVLQEATLFWALRHPNIIQLMGVCFQEPNFCLIMEYAKGGSLGRLLSVRKNGFPPYILIKWALQVSQCMFYLHEQASPYRIPIIHRDLKSSNILLSEDALSGEHRLADIQLKLTDFGLARELNKTAKDLSTAGTYSHMPPEVIKSSNYTKASDVWSFGVLLWELLTGEIPYKGIDPLTVAYGVAVNKLTLPVPSSCPQVFSDLIKACWHPDPHKRITFEQINQCLIDISNSPFALTPSESFWTMQQDWKSEIEEMFMQIKIREEELRSREEELERVIMRQQAYENMLRQREKALEEREKDLVIRELSMALQQKTTPYHMYPPAPIQPTPEPKKRKKSGRLLTNFLRSSSNSHGSSSSNLNTQNNNINISSTQQQQPSTMKSLEISSPSDFQHCMSIQHAIIDMPTTSFFLNHTLDNGVGGGGVSTGTNPGTPDTEPSSYSAATQSPLPLIPPATLPVLPTTMHATSNGGGSGYNSCHAGNTPTATATHFVFSPTAGGASAASAVAANSNPTMTTNSASGGVATSHHHNHHQGSVSPNMRLRITLQPSLDRGMGPSNSFIVYPSSPAQQQLAYMMINNNNNNQSGNTNSNNHQMASSNQSHNHSHHLSPNTRSSRLQMKSISIDNSYNYPTYVVNPYNGDSNGSIVENGATYPSQQQQQHASRSKTSVNTHKQTISPNNGVHNTSNALDANSIMEYVSVSHSPSMRSISADVGHHHNYTHTNNQNYHLMNKSQDLVSIHSANSTSLVSGLNSSNLINNTVAVNNNLSSSNANSVNKSSQQQQQHISNRKLSRILYEIGSILSFVGLGKDYKHQQQQTQQMTAPQTPSSLHSNTVLLTSQPSTPKPSSKHHARRSQDQKKQTINSGQAEQSHSTSNSVSGFIKSHAKSMLSSNPLKEQHQQQQHLAGYAANVGSGAHELVGVHHLQHHQHQSPSHSLTRLTGGNVITAAPTPPSNHSSSAALNTTSTVKSRFKSLSSTSGSHMAAASNYHKSFEDRGDDEEVVMSKRLSPSSAARNAASALVAQSAAAQAASTSSLLSVDMPIASSSCSSMSKRDNNLLSPRSTIVRQESLNPPPSTGLYANNNTQIMRSMQKKYSKSIDCTPHHLNLNTTIAATAQMYLDPHHHQMNQSNTNHTMSSSNSGISYSGSYINNSNNQLCSSSAAVNSHTSNAQNNQSSMSSISSISQSNSIYGGNVTSNVIGSGSGNYASEVSSNSTMTNSPLVPRRADYEPMVRISTIQRQNRIYEQPSPTIAGLEENFSYSPNSTSQYYTGANMNKSHVTNQAISSPNLPNRPITLDLKQPFNDSNNDIIELMGSGQIVSINKTKSPSPMSESVIQSANENMNNVSLSNKNQISPPSNLIQMNNTVSKVMGGSSSSSHRQQLQMNMRDTSPFSSLSSSSAAASSVPSSLSPMGTSPRLLHKPISNHSNQHHPPPPPPPPPHNHQSQC